MTLHPTQRVDIHYTYTLIVDGTAQEGLNNIQGQLLDGADTGLADSNYAGLLTWRNLLLDPLPDESRWSKTSFEDANLLDVRGFDHDFDVLGLSGDCEDET